MYTRFLLPIIVIITTVVSLDNIIRERITGKSIHNDDAGLNTLNTKSPYKGQCVDRFVCNINHWGIFK